MHFLHAITANYLLFNSTRDGASLGPECLIIEMCKSPKFLEVDNKNNWRARHQGHRCTKTYKRRHTAWKECQKCSLCYVVFRPKIGAIQRCMNYIVSCLLDGIFEFIIISLCNLTFLIGFKGLQIMGEVKIGLNLSPL